MAERAAILAAAMAAFPGQAVEVVPPPAQEYADGEGKEWSVLVGPERNHCYLVAELLPGGYDFEQID